MGRLENLPRTSMPKRFKVLLSVFMVNFISTIIASFVSFGDPDSNAFDIIFIMWGIYVCLFMFVFFYSICTTMRKTNQRVDQSNQEPFLFNGNNPESSSGPLYNHLVAFSNSWGYFLQVTMQ